MKFSAAILMVIWGTLMVQPSFAYFGGKSAYGGCTEKKEPTKISCTKARDEFSGCKKKKVITTGCSKNKCNKPTSPKEKDNCSTDGCNPTLGCSSGNFYIHHYFQIALSSWFTQKQKAVLIDDNRICSNFSEFWHPPEA